MFFLPIKPQVCIETKGQLKTLLVFHCLSHKYSALSRSFSVAKALLCPLLKIVDGKPIVLVHTIEYESTYMTSFSKGVEYTKVRALLDQNFKKGCYEVLPQTMYPSPFTSGKKSVEKKNGKKQALYITPPLLALRETNHVKHNQPPPEKRQVPKEPAKVFPAISPSYLNSVPKNEGLGHFQRNKEETNRKCRHMFRIAIIAKQDFSSDEHISDESHLLLDVPDWSEEDLNALVEIEKHVCCSRSNFEPQISNSRQLVQNQVPNIQRVETCILETPMEIHDEAKKVAQVQSPKVEPTNERVFESSETPTRQLLSWKLEAAESLLERLNSRLLKSTKMEEAVKLRKDIEDVIHKKNEIIAQMTENNRDSVSYDENTGQTNLYPLESSSSAKVDSHEETSVPTMDNYCVAETRFTQSTCDKPQNNEMLNNNSKSSEMELRSVKNDTTHLEWTGEFPWTYQLKKDNFIYFGNVSFRPNQLESMNAILSNRDVFVLMPTGGGKSLCYQLPALWGPGVTIVVSPLISLITDQVSQLHERGIFAAALTASTTAQVRKSIFDDLRATFPRLRLLYVTPERISKSAMFHKYLTQLYNRNLLARFVIDEAHCVSQWGHDFRPDYTQLKLLKREFRGIPIMALTATATVEVREDIKVQLGIPNCVTFQQSFNRSNLTYYVREKKKNAIQEIAQEIRDKYARQCGIIYCLSQRDCEVLADTLYREYEILAAPYHAGLSDERRQLTHEDWMYGRVHVICATVAFGMGINKGDVRYVYHYSMPKNIEGYYQESGRAGRDGKRSDCILYFSHADRFRLLRMISDSEGSQEQILRNEQGVAKMASYCLNDVECRRQLLLAYFSESFDPVHCNPPCDNCAYTGK